MGSTVGHRGTSVPSSPSGESPTGRPVPFRLRLARPSRLPSPGQTVGPLPAPALPIEKQIPPLHFRKYQFNTTPGKHVYFSPIERKEEKKRKKERKPKEKSCKSTQIFLSIHLSLSAGYL